METTVVIKYSTATLIIHRFSDFFTTFDKTACRWERAENTQCSLDTSSTTTRMGLTLFYPLESRKEISARVEEVSASSTTTEPTTTSTDAPTTTTTEFIDQDDMTKQSISTTTRADAPATKTPATTTAELVAPNDTTPTTMSLIQDSEMFEMDLNKNQNLVHTSRALPAGTQNRVPPRKVFHLSGRVPDESSAFTSPD